VCKHFMCSCSYDFSSYLFNDIKFHATIFFSALMHNFFSSYLLFTFSHYEHECSLKSKGLILGKYQFYQIPASGLLPFQRYLYFRSKINRENLYFPFTPCRSIGGTNVVEKPTSKFALFGVSVAVSQT